MEARKKFAQRLKQLRQLKGVHQKELAAYLGLRVSTISAYELGTGTPTLENYIKIADYFEVSLDFLMCRYDDMESIKAEDLPPELQALGIDEIKINKLSTEELQQELSELSSYADKINKILKALGK